MTEQLQQEMKFLKGTRAHLRTKCTKKHADVCANVREFTDAKARCMVDEFKEMNAKLEDLNTDVQRLLYKLDFEAGVIGAELITCDEYEDKVSNAVGLLQALIASRAAEAAEVTAVAAAQAALNASSVGIPAGDASAGLRLPDLPLPEFNYEEGDSFENFISDFEQTIFKYPLSNYKRYIYLVRQVKGGALELIKSLRGEQKSYDDAKELLTRAFASPTVQKFDLMKKLTNLNLKSSGNCLAFVSEMRVILSSVESLQITVEDICQYFIWRAMPFDLQTQLMTITNNNRPTVQEIADNIFIAIERFTAIQKQKRDSLPKKNDNASFKRPATAAAAFSAGVGSSESNFKGRSCVLCSTSDKQADHKINQCGRYSTSKEKISKLKSMGACVRCGGGSHKAESCAFRFFRDCTCCGAAHFVYLCPNESSKPKINASVSTLNVIVEATTLNFYSEFPTLLPTFTAPLDDGSLIHGLKDTGAQCSIILNSFAESHNLRTLSEIDITINGFNSSKPYRSKVVQVPVRIGDSVKSVNAVCVPDINIRLKLRGLNKLVSALVSNGYTLADKTLLDVNESELVHNIDLILGANFSHLLPETDRIFSNSNNNCFNSSLGAILMGDMHEIYACLTSDVTRVEANKPIVTGTPVLPSAVHAACSRQVPARDAAGACLVESVPANVCTAVPALLSGEGLVPPMPCEEHGSVGAQCGAVGADGVSVSTGDPAMQSDDTGEPNIVYIFPMTTNDEFDDAELSKLLRDHIKNLDPAHLDEKCADILDSSCFIDSAEPDSESSVEEILSKFYRNDDGRLVVPILFNERNSHKLAKNLNLARQILFSNFRKYRNCPEKLSLIDGVFSEQLESGVIEKIDDLDEFLKNNKACSFLSHMAIFKMSNLSTRCRVVYLSNLAERKDGQGLSHNQTIKCGPTSMNVKLATAITRLRFDKFLLSYDLVKSFLQLAIPPEHQIKLCFLWFDNVHDESRKLTGFYLKRVPFGLRCSGALLSLALYYILVREKSQNEDELRDLKRLLFFLTYVDNGSYTSDGSDDIKFTLESLDRIFNPFGFSVQQIVTNDPLTQKNVDKKSDTVTPDEVKLLGLEWQRSTDVFSCRNLELDLNANTKRHILSSIASNYDLLGMNLPILNRARLFLHDLQNNGINWDDTLPPDSLRLWKNIARQYNASPKVSIDRSFGSRSDEYKLCCFTDSSSLIFGAVLYLYNCNSNKTTFLLAKNRIISKKNETRSVPTLELMAVAFGTEVAQDAYNELCECGDFPVKINDILLYTDSATCLSWIRAYSATFEKFNDKSVFVRNRLNHIYSMCEKMPVTFNFCCGPENPADAVTRPISFGLLKKSTFLQGFLPASSADSEFPPVRVPSITVRPQVECGAVTLATETPEQLYDFSRHSKFSKLCNVAFYVRKFIDNCKRKCREKTGNAASFTVLSDADMRAEAVRDLLRQEQSCRFPEVLEFFRNPEVFPVKDIPNVVHQLNVFKDSDGLIRVKAKFKSWGPDGKFPVLLDKNSFLTTLIVRDFHEKTSHGGIYSVLSEFRKLFYLQHCFSAIKKVITKCVLCRKVNARPVKLSQNAYRDFRLSPSHIPYRTAFLDMIGPVNIRVNGEKIKVHLLCISCLFSRAINLKICMDLSLKNFLRALQLHVLEFGVPQLILSDCGSALVSAGNILNEYLGDEVTKTYLNENGIQSFDFRHYPKGCNKLGGLIESSVKLVKRLIYGSIRNNVLDYPGFEYLVCLTVHLVNRRPIAFKESLRQTLADQNLPAPITPEILVRGYELVSVNILPYFDISRDTDTDWSPLGDVESVRSGFEQLKKCRDVLVDLYHVEFMSNLMDQATVGCDKYKKVDHILLKPGDLVLIKDSMQKPTNYPLAVVLDAQKNSLGEVTAVTVRKGCNREVVTRHVQSIIPLMTVNLLDGPGVDIVGGVLSENNSAKSRRKAAAASRTRLAGLIADGAV